MLSCKLVGQVTVNGVASAATIVATPILPKQKDGVTDQTVPSGFTAPAVKNYTVPSTGIIPTSPTLDVTGDNATWPRDNAYSLAITANGVTVTQNVKTRVGTVDIGTVNIVAAGAPSVLLTDAATIAIDAKASGHQKVILGGNRTLGNPSGAYDGQVLRITVGQDATGSRTVTLGNKYRVPTGMTITWSTAANKKDKIAVQYDATDDKFDVLQFQAGY